MDNPVTGSRYWRYSRYEKNIGNHGQMKYLGGKKCTVYRCYAMKPRCDMEYVLRRKSAVCSCYAIETRRDVCQADKALFHLAKDCRGYARDLDVLSRVSIDPVSFYCNEA